MYVYTVQPQYNDFLDLTNFLKSPRTFLRERANANNTSTLRIHLSKAFL